VSPAVRRRDGTIEVETSRLRLRLDLEALQFDLCSADAATRLVGCRPCARLGAHELYGRGAILDGFEEIDSALGPATRLRLRASSDAGLDLELDLEVGEDWPGIVAALEIRSRADAPVRLTALEPLGCTGVTLPGDPALLRFYRMGYQSWSPAGRLPLGGPGGHDARPRPGVIGKMHFGPFTPSARRGLHVSDWVASLGAEGEPGVTLGFLTHRTSLGHVVLEHGRSRVDALRARSAAEDLALAPGESFASERLWVGLDPAGSDGIAAWAERAGTEMGAPVPGEVGAGWCSWYHFFTRVGAEEIRRNAEALGPYRGQLETVQIDDGFQAQIGDWLEPDDAFPGGVAPLAAAIRDSGFRAGLWLAPFIASRTSRLAREHPDWLLRDRKGKPVST
jgi:alpha-galactosidase